MLTQLQGATIDEERHRDEERRHARHRSLADAGVERPSLSARLGAAVMSLARRDRGSLTGYACRLPDGKVGRTAFVKQGDEWLLVCRVA
jgi:hypothetical protein